MTGRSGGGASYVIGLVIPVLLLAGCAHYVPQPISPSAEAAALESRSLDDARLQEFVSVALRFARGSSASSSWDLTKLTLVALYYQPDLKIVYSKLAAAQAGVITARQHPNPTLDVSAIVATAAVSGAIPPGAIPATVGPTINFLLETFGKRQYRTTQALQLVQAAQWDLATAAWQVRGRVRTAMLNLWAAQQRLALTRQRLDLEEQLVAILEKRFTIGGASSLDVTRERINRAQLILGIRDLERAEADTRVQLATAIGIPVHALEPATLSLSAFDQPQAGLLKYTKGELRRQALIRRTDVQSTLAQYEATQSALQLQIANQYPNLTLGPGYNYDIGVNKYIFSPALELPILNQNQGPIAQAIANRQQAAANFIALQAQIIGAIDQAAASYREATASVVAADALVAEEKTRVHQIEESFRAGQTDRSTLVTTELGLAAIQLSRFDAVVLQRQAIGDLEDAVQRPFFDPDARFLLSKTSPRIVSNPL